MSSLYRSLAKQVPVVSDQAKRALEAGRQVQLKQSLGSIQPSPNANVARVAQQAAAQDITQAGQQNMAVREQSAQTLAGVAQGELQQTEAAQRNILADRDQASRSRIQAAQNAQSLSTSRANIAAQKEVTSAEIASKERLAQFGIEQDNQLLNISLDTRERLSALGEDVKDKLLDSRIRFERDQDGRKFSNERQLADYAAANARTDIEFQQKMRDMQEVAERKILMMEIAYRKLEQAERQGFMKEDQRLDFESTRALAQRKAALEKKIRKEQAKARNNMMIAQGIGTVVGAAAGSFVPGGTAAGAVIGGSLGTAIYGATQ